MNKIDSFNFSQYRNKIFDTFSDLFARELDVKNQQYVRLLNHFVTKNHINIADDIHKFELEQSSIITFQKNNQSIAINTIHYFHSDYSLEHCMKITFTETFRNHNSQVIHNIQFTSPLLNLHDFANAFTKINKTNNNNVNDFSSFLIKMFHMKLYFSA